MTATAFKKSKKKVFNFIDQVAYEDALDADREAYKKNLSYKLIKLDNAKQRTKDECLDNMFGALYKDAIPLGDEYKDAYRDDLDASTKGFMAKIAPRGVEYYINEGPAKHSKFAKKVLESVEKAVKDEYNDMELTADDVKPDDIDDFTKDQNVQRRVNVIGQNLSAPEVSEMIKRNVKQTALAEITKAKKEKEDAREFESQLAQDPSITTKEDVERVEALRRPSEFVTYTPTLFEGIMINKMNKYSALQESGKFNPIPLYGALKEYKDVKYEDTATVEDMAFIETVIEYTGWTMLKALKMESFGGSRIKDLAAEYASESFE